MGARGWEENSALGTTDHVSQQRVEGNHCEYWNHLMEDIQWLFASLLFTAICKASPDSHFAFLHFFSTGMVLIPVSCTMS